MKFTAKKVKMTQVWKEDAVVPVTVLRWDAFPEEGEWAVAEGDAVTISGRSKGRGFQGVVKRHGFHGGPQTHGQKNRLRAPGSIGSTAPQRVVPGRRMAGRMGNARVTLKGVRVVEVDKEKKLLFVHGAVPGMRGTVVEVRISSL